MGGGLARFTNGKYRGSVMNIKISFSESGECGGGSKDTPFNDL